MSALNWFGDYAAVKDQEIRSAFRRALSEETRVLQSSNLGM